jgi:hypothetical protein
MNVIYNEDKTQILKYEDCDVNKGYFKEDKLTVHHDAVEGVEEEGHYETIAEYPNGGKDVKWVIDKPGIEANEAYDEELDIYVYIKYTEEQLKKKENQQELLRLKSELESTDYKAIKYAEGWYTEEEYLPIKTERERIRKEIRKLENA